MRPFTPVLLLTPVILAGCAMTPTASPSSQAGVAIRGRVHGGQQPVVGAHVFLFAANHTGYGGSGLSAAPTNSSISLLNNVPGSTAVDGTSGPTYGDYFVTTGSDGTFSITNDYQCTSGQQLYLYAKGGNSDYPSGTANPAIGLLAALGTCPSSGSLASAIPFVMLNEVSTVATAFGFAAFASDAVHVSSSGTPLARTGIANAFLSVTNLEDLASGTALDTTPAGNGAAPQATVNTLADILAACINTTSAGSTNCTTLLSNAVDQQGNQATDTASAAINIAHNPAISSTNPNVSLANLFNLAAGEGAPFQSTLSAPPSDFTLGINYLGGGLGVNGVPAGIAIDAAGNVWTANQSGTLSELSTTGAPLSTDDGFSGGGLDTPTALAIDTTGNIWIANAGNDSLSEFSSAGSPAAASPYTGGGLSDPQAMAIDPSGNIWLADSSVNDNPVNSLSEFSGTGIPISPANGYTGGGLESAASLAIDVAGDVWVSDTGGAIGIISEFSSKGSPLSATGYNPGVIYPASIAIDGSGDIWAADSSDGIGGISNAGLPITDQWEDTNGGLNFPDAIAIDGSGDLWAANTLTSTVSELTNAGAALSPNGYTSGGLNAMNAIAIDGSGNVWITNGGEGGDGSVSEIIGVATPVVTPLVANLVAPYRAAASKP